MKFASKSFPMRIAWVPGLVLIDMRDHDPRPDDEHDEALMQAVDAAARAGEVAMLVRNVNSHAPLAESREVLLAHIQGLGERFVGVFISVQKGGLRTAAFRTFMSATRLITGIPVAVRPSLEAAIATMHERTEVATTQRPAIDSFFSAADIPPRSAHSAR